MQNADGAREQAEHADDGEAGKDGEDEGLGHLARHYGEAHGGNGKAKGEQHHETNIAVAARAVATGSA